MKIAPQHQRALIAHASDALRVTPQAATSFVAGLLGDEPSYADLAGVDLALVSNEATRRGIDAPGLRLKATVALMTELGESAPVCSGCGRFPMKLSGNTWEAIEGKVCPVDQGIYQHVERVEVIAWSDGRRYPEGTTHDADRVPITDEAIRAARTVDSAILAEAGRFSVTITDVCAALRERARTPAAALSLLVDPWREFHDVAKLREFVAAAKGAVGRLTAVGSPTGSAVSRPVPTESVSWQRLSGAHLRLMQAALLSAFPNEGALSRFVAHELNENLHAITSGNLDNRVFELIGWSQARGGTQVLFAKARLANPGNEALRSLAASWGMP